MVNLAGTSVANQRARRAAAARRDSANTTPRSSMGDLHVREVGEEPRNNNSDSLKGFGRGNLEFSGKTIKGTLTRCCVQPRTPQLTCNLLALTSV